MTTPKAPIGWPLLPLPDASGRLTWPDLTESVLQQIRVLLSTRPGEQLGHPTFGGGLQELVGLPDTVETRTRIRERVERTLRAHERRVLLEGVDVTDDPAQLGFVRVDVRFRIRRTGASHRVGLTLALERGV